MTSRAVPPHYSPPAKKHIHRHGKGTANAQTGTIDVLGPGDAPVGAHTVDRERVSAFSNRPGLRHQSSRADSGDHGPERRGGAYQDSSDAKKRDRK